MEEISSHKSKTNIKSVDLSIKSLEIKKQFQDNNNKIFKSVNVNNFKEENVINNNHLYSETSSNFLQEKDNKTPSLVELNTNNSQLNNNNIINDEISIISKTSSYLRAVNIFNRNNIVNEINEKVETNKDCLICYEKLTFEELQNNFIGCFHGFCDDCLYNYFKEKINNNEVEKIKCPQHGCNQLIYNNFIEMKISNDVNLLEKYVKFTKRRQLMMDPNVQL